MGLLHINQCLPEEIFHREAHNEVPHTLPVVEYPRVLLLLLCAVEEAAGKTYQQIFEDPLHELPEHEIVLIHCILRVCRIRGGKLEPREYLVVKLGSQGYSGERLKAVELHELEHLLAKDLPILAFEEVFGKNLSYEFCKEISYLPIFSVSSLEKLLIHLASLVWAFLSLFNKLLFSGLPSLRTLQTGLGSAWHGTVFVHVVPIVEGLLLLDDMVQNGENILLKFRTHAGESEYVLEQLLFHYVSRSILAVVQDMLLEELGTAVHVRAVEHAVPVDLFLTEGTSLLGLDIRIGFASHLVLMGLNVHPLFLNLCIIYGLLLILAALIERGLESAQSVAEVAEDVGARDLD